MAKQSAWLKQQQERFKAEKEADMKIARLFCIQQCRDMMVIAANREFGFGSERAKRLLEAFDSTFLAYAFEVIDDVKADADIEYSKAQVDGALKQIMGDNFVPWDERYSW